MRVADWRWRTVQVAAGMGEGTVALRVGEVGSGSPVGLVVAGVHGDEAPWALLAVHKLLADLEAREIRGTLRIVPSANPLAVQVGARENLLDRLDLNSSFPGRSDGTHTERLAAALVENALRGADFVLDVHGGGSWNINCFTYQLPGSEDLASWLGTRLVANGPNRSTSLTGYAVSLGAKAVWIESGGRGMKEDERARSVATGMRQALGRAGVLAPVAEAVSTADRAEEWDAVVSTIGGIYVPEVGEDNLGSVVARGTLIGTLWDSVTGQVIEEYRAPYPKTLLALIRPTVAVIDGPGRVIAAVATTA